MMRILPAVLGLAAIVVIVAGCAQREEYVDTEPTFPISESGAVLNWAQLEAVPQPVRNAFLRQHPRAGITDVLVLNAVTGRLVYQINYVDADGVPGQALYAIDGQRLPRPSPDPALEMAPPAMPGGATGLQ
jgi:hypothetical protein